MTEKERVSEAEAERSLAEMIAGKRRDTITWPEVAVVAVVLLFVLALVLTIRGF